MRFLCLHGYATNAEVLEQQLLPLRNHLPSDWEFEFLEARQEPSSIFLPSLEGDLDSLYAWYNLPLKDDIENALEDILDFVDSEGPFDGILGFSQGGLMAATLLLWDASRPEGPQLPFKMAVFISTFAPHNATTSTVMWDLDDGELVATATGLSCETAWKVDPRTSFDFNVLKGNLDKLSFPVHLLPKHNPKDDDVRINIPAVFVRGQHEPNDVGFDQFLGLVSTPALQTMCHSGGHHFPKPSWEIAHMAELIVKTSLQSVSGSAGLNLAKI
ncbi:FSH1 domain-containing protein [Fusarium sp. LHS14.1]|nr:FSH1 domain-containing protein [Fusarium sp. LHS14.1]